MTVIADTSFIVETVLTARKFHQVCLATYQQQTIIYVPQTTLAETMYLIHKYAGNPAAIQFLEHIVKQRSKYQLVELIDEDIEQTINILRRYSDSRVDFVDATVAAVAERLNITTILTLDNRDFTIIRPKHTGYFTLLP